MLVQRLVALSQMTLAELENLLDSNGPTIDIASTLRL